MCTLVISTKSEKWVSNGWSRLLNADWLLSGDIYSRCQAWTYGDIVDLAPTWWSNQVRLWESKGSINNKFQTESRQHFEQVGGVLCFQIESARVLMFSVVEEDEAPKCTELMSTCFSVICKTSNVDLEQKVRIQSSLTSDCSLSHRNLCTAHWSLGVVH